MATDTTKDKSWVQKTPGVCGGRACIRNTRITVWGLVNFRDNEADWESGRLLIRTAFASRHSSCQASDCYNRDELDALEE
jgi:hypothetical protein